jgi:sortase A
MHPNNNDDTGRNVNVPNRPQSGGLRTPDRDAAAQLMRQQINSIYDEADSSKPKEPVNVYKQSHSEILDHAAAKPEQSSDWKQYHSAWQSYYQQYYERYYMAQLHRRQQTIRPASNASTAPQAQPSGIVTSSSPAVTQNEAVNELRTKLLNEVRHRSTKVRRSRHFMPLVAALTVALVFSFLQYNRLFVAQVKAYVSPGSINPQNVILDPTASTKVGPEPRIVIPKINVDAPVVYDVPSLDEHVIQTKLRDGVVHYPIPGASSVPGQKGNTVILGHSSNDVFDDGDYKFVFVQLDNINVGDSFYLNYNGTRYTYSVKEKKVIMPNEVGQLVIDSDTPLATLVTCTPPGTALKRLVVIAEQISPDPASASAKDTASAPAEPFSIAGNSPTLFERLFGGN